MIRIENLVKRFDTHYAVSNVSFTVQKGEIIGFLGPNGAGKSTTMRIITGYLPADNGDVFIDDLSIALDPMQVKSKIGYLPESAPLYGDMQVDEYLAFIARARGIADSDIMKKIQKVGKQVGLEHVFKKNIDELSKGYRQRVGLAQALIHNPDVLILDEPTSGLDPIQIQEIRKLIRELGKEKTVILSTHIMQEVEAVCDRVLIISRGQIVAEGTPAELRAKTKGGASLTVTIRADKAKIESALNQFSGLTSRSLISEENGLYRYVLTTPERSAERVFRWAVDNQFILTELTEKEESLEDLFLQLTQTEAQ